MSAKVKQRKTKFEECQIALGTRTEKVHLASEVKIANEIM
jgi:hypothetical protein